MRKFGNEKMRWRLQGTRYRRGLTLAKVVARRAGASRTGRLISKLENEQMRRYESLGHRR